MFQDPPSPPRDGRDPHTLRLFDLAPEESIIVRCECGRITEYPRGLLQRRHRLPSDTLIYDLQYRLRCDGLLRASGPGQRAPDEADLKTLKHLARKGTPGNSFRALTSDLAYLEAWCRAATDQVLPRPAPEGLASKFVAHHLYDAVERARNPDHGMPKAVEAALWARDLLRTEGPHAPATVRRRLSIWATLHRIRGVDGAFGSASLREAVKRAGKAGGRPRLCKSRRAITRSILEDLLDTCADGGPAALRDRALLLVTFGSGGRRRSELAELKVEQLVEELPVPADPANPQSPQLPCMTIELGRTKTSDAEEGRTVKLVGRPVGALAVWLESEGITSGPVFRHIDRWENVGDRPMSPAGINHMIKRRLALAGCDEADYSAHGLRAGT